MSNERQDQTAEGVDTPKETREQTERKVLSEAERVRALRDRLYARGKPPESLERHSLGVSAPIPKMSEGEPERPPSYKVADIVRPRQGQGSVTPPQGSDDSKATIESIDTMTQQKRSRRYRLKLALFGIVFFVGALLVSSAFLFWGNNTISGENISVSASGPLTVPGGGEISFQVSVANQNVQPIESATLIIEYPRGTQSVEEQGKEMYSDRRQLNRVATGEVVNVPLKAIVFGEENEEQEIKVAIEYRIAGSNATFRKEADSLKYKVSSSPITLELETLKEISSGQELSLTIDITSNAATPLTDLLVKVSYPYGFDYTSASTEPVSGEDVWKIPILKPGEKKSVTIKGIATGNEEDSLRFSVNVGVPNERDKLSLASVLVSDSTDVGIEQPFLNVDVSVNGGRDDDGVSVIRGRDRASVEIMFENTLDTVIFDGTIRAELSGNALDESTVEPLGGFYDSMTNTITWDKVGVPTLGEIQSKSENSVQFSLVPRADVTKSPELQVKVTVNGQRIFEDRVPQSLSGTAEQTVKIEGQPKFSSYGVYSDGPYQNTGPVPPVAEKVTQYTYLLAVTAGTNDLTGAEVIAVLPQHMSWLDLVTEGDDITYSPTTRTMKWNIGNLDANARAEAWIQVSLTPSLSQVGKTLKILETQRFQATDRFTGTVVRSEAPELTTELRNDPDPALSDGRVRANE